MELKNLTVTEFVDITASNAPAPGGGSVSALAGTLATALSQMVANLTIGKKKYQDVWEEMGVRAETLKQAQAELLAAVDKDSSAFDLYMEALTLPKDTEEQIATRKAAMENGLKAAVAVEEQALAGEGRILVRASGTEPLIRVMVEAKTIEKARASMSESVKRSVLSI